MASPTTIPMLDMRAHLAPLRADLLRALERVVDSGQFILGPEVERLEERLAAYSGCRHAIGVTSGTDALLVALMALGIGPGDEVVTSPFTFFATAGTIARLGARPVFVDIEPQTFNLNPGLLAKAITPKTKAIIPVHLYGQCADMDAILTVAGRANVRILEDAAQAIGAEYRPGRTAGSIGAAGCLSFFPTKNLGGLGEGGMVVTNDDALADRIRMLRVHGSREKYRHEAVGGNFRLNALQAAGLNVLLDHLDDWTAKRMANGARYRELIEGRRLPETAGVVVPIPVHEQGGVTRPHIYHQYVIRAPRRDALRNHLAAAGIGSEVYYPIPLHLQPCFRNLGYGEGSLPEAERAAREVLALPIHPELTQAQQDTVVEAISAFYAKG
jgi:dTDP-4-amino-4,6-dideoxygalactose transaminase